MSEFHLQPKSSISNRSPLRVAITVLAVIVIGSLANPVTAGDDRPELWPGDRRLQAQVSGGTVNLSSRLATRQGDHIVFPSFKTKHYCKGYQGDVNKVFMRIPADSGQLENRNKRYGDGQLTRIHEWHDVKVFTVQEVVAACEGRSDVVDLRKQVKAWNTCGRNERHTRNGGGTVTLQLQCSPSSIRAQAQPIRWRYTCEGPNMYVQGTNERSVERDAPNAVVNCVYRGR